jgi:cholesterol transport system auxiliary component
VRRPANSDRFLATLMGIALWLVACAGPVASPDRHYRLEAPAPTRRLDTPPIPGTLTVERLRGGGLLDQLPLVYRMERDSSELHQHRYSRWIDTPTMLLQQEMTDYLRAAGVAERVVTSDLGVDGDFALQGRLLRLERVLDDEASVEISLELAVLRTQSSQLVQQKTYRAERSVESREVAASVAALEDALGEILNRFTADLAGIDVPD